MPKWDQIVAHSSINKLGFLESRNIMIGVIFIVILVIGYFLILNSKVKNKGTLLLEKVVTALLSTLLFSLIFACFEHTPIEEQEVNIGYFSFGELFGVYLMYSLPVFLLCGGLYSFFADIFLKNIRCRNSLLKYIAGLLVYLVGGLLIVGVFYLILLIIYEDFSELFILDLLKVSALPSLLFYHISLLYKGILKFFR